ncbi:MAG TPA: ABC transporter permease subunit, partial [Acidimicrobiia bacterium]
RRFLQIELPLAAPVIIAGIRIASVTVIGLVTVTSLLGLGGLGFFILDGLRRSILFPTEIIVGTVLSAALAAVVDLGLLGLERWITPWQRGRA